MPRNVRNFWLEGTIDGRQSPITGGPVSKDGGFYLTIYQRDDGGVTTAITIEGVVGPQGELKTKVFTRDREKAIIVKTRR